MATTAKLKLPRHNQPNPHHPKPEKRRGSLPYSCIATTPRGGNSEILTRFGDKAVGDWGAGSQETEYIGARDIKGGVEAPRV